jgi:hypothetical protein
LESTVEGRVATPRTDPESNASALPRRYLQRPPRDSWVVVTLW